MNRYLSQYALELALANGWTVEQWLGVRTEGALRVLKWISIERELDGRSIVRLVEVIDIGGPEFIDVMNLPRSILKLRMVSSLNLTLQRRRYSSRSLKPEQFQADL